MAGTSRRPAQAKTTEAVDEQAAGEAAAKDTDSLVAQAKGVFKDDLPKGIHQKMNMILARMPENMRPEGNNKHFHYDYWTLDQISGYFRNRFGDLGLSFMADVEEYNLLEHPTSKEGRSTLTTLIIRFTLTDSDTGEFVSGRGIGQGDDPGDKGANKAFSGALKYWLLKVFVVGGDDAEADDRTDDRDERDERPRGRRSSRSSSSRDEERENRDVTITDSKIEGIQRGGRSSHTTDAQIRQIRMLAKDLEWNATGAARRISEWLDDDLDLPEDVETHGDFLVRYLEGLSADDAGMVVTKMIELRDAPAEEESDDDDRGAPGYGD